MIKGLIYRSWSLSSKFGKADKSIIKLFELLNKNGYSKFLLEKLSKETLDKLLNTQKDVDSVSVKISEPLKSHILVIPYSEGFKDFRNSVLKVLDSSRFKIISQSKKSLNMFSNKCRTPMGLASDLVYQFTCDGCNATHLYAISVA